MFSYLTNKLYQITKFSRAACDNGKKASSWSAPPVGPPVLGTLQSQLKFWKGQKRSLGSLTNSVTQRKIGGRINEQRI